MTTESKMTGLDLMRAPFPANQISLLPKPTKGRDEMAKLPKATCKECGGYHATSNIIHLSYVGHAALTDRLLDCDPSWNWEPLAIDGMGLPMLDKDGGLWIKLTVCGVTRMGYGDAQGKTGGDAMKERIGDALRNAAMRFGAALDLWHKGELHVDDDEPAKPEPRQQKDVSGTQSADIITANQAKMLHAKMKATGAEVSSFKEHFKVQEVELLPKAKMNEALKFIEGK